ncbi:MAG: hypothetical protein JO256_13265 [Alphaproteobacteria bacterium]|nr:hypothetical protein [Alphaproteobacteria bacterium]
MRKLILAAPAAIAFFAIVPVLAQQAAPSSSVETIRSQAAPIPDSAITGFVKTFTAPSELSGKIPRWFTGICLKTQGLPRELSEAVSKRILEIAQQVGAPVGKQPCNLNSVVIFDADPQGVMDDIAANHQELLGPHDIAQTKDLAKIRFPIQAWYATETQDDKGINVVDSKEQSALCGSVDTTTMVGAPGDLKNGGLRFDPARFSQANLDLQRYCGHEFDTGNRLRNGKHSHIVAVTVVANMDTMRFHELSAVADYLALVILSQTKAFERCEKMETIANLLVPACDLDNRIKGLMPGDVAFLKALYRADTGGNLVAQQSSITGEMKKLLAAEQTVPAR